MMNIIIKDIDLSDDNTIYIKKIDGKYYARHSHVMGFSSEVEEVTDCKNCKHAPKCYGDVCMTSRSGTVYKPLTYCSEGESNEHSN